MKRFKISLLNPDEKQQIIVDKVLTPLSGINWIKCEIKASDGKEIETYQFDKANKRVGEMSKINIWSDSFLQFHNLNINKYGQTNYW